MAKYYHLRIKYNPKAAIVDIEKGEIDLSVNTDRWNHVNFDVYHEGERVTISRKSNELHVGPRGALTLYQKGEIMQETKVKRGCGTRVPGAAYVCTDFSPHGLPPDAFLFDPPWVPVDKKGNYHYPNRVGLHFVEKVNQNNTYDLWDWIGEEHYPFFPDFWEEFLRYGLSRRISVTADFDNLSRTSKIVGFHKCGLLSATYQLYEHLKDEWEYGTGYDLCPKNLDHAKEDDAYCIRFAWQLTGQLEEDKERLYKRGVPTRDPEPQFTYDAAYAPWWIWEPRYKAEWIAAAMFALPITRIEVIEDDIGGLHEIAVEKLDKSITDVPFVVVKEQ